MRKPKLLLLRKEDERFLDVSWHQSEKVLKDCVVDPLTQLYHDISQSIYLFFSYVAFCLVIQSTVMIKEISWRTCSTLLWILHYMLLLWHVYKTIKCILNKSGNNEFASLILDTEQCMLLRYNNMEVLVVSEMRQDSGMEHALKNKLF